MSKLYDLLSAMCGKIKKPDWEQNNPTAADYVKNRPFWTGDTVEKVIFEEHLVMEEVWAELPETTYPVFEENQEYQVNINGENYTCIAYYSDYDGTVVIGNVAISNSGAEPTGNNEPFYIAIWDDGWVYIAVAEPGEYDISIIGNIAEVHKIDNKYIDKSILADAINKAEEAFEMADYAIYKAEETAGKVPLFATVSNLNLELKPTTTKQLAVGEFCHIETDFVYYGNMITNSPLGSNIYTYLKYYIDGVSMPPAETILLTKVDNRTFEGGAWVSNAGVTQYIDIKLRPNSMNSYYTRKI